MIKLQIKLLREVQRKLSEESFSLLLVVVLFRPRAVKVSLRFVETQSKPLLHPKIRCEVEVVDKKTQLHCRCPSMFDDALCQSPPRQPKLAQSSLSRSVPRGWRSPTSLARPAAKSSRPVERCLVKSSPVQPNFRRCNPVLCHPHLYPWPHSKPPSGGK